MVLLVCSECWKEVSNSADKCPNCWTPMLIIIKETKKKEKEKQLKDHITALYLSFWGIWLGGFIALYLWYMLIGFLSLAFFLLIWLHPYKNEKEINYKIFKKRILQWKKHIIRVVLSIFIFVWIVWLWINWVVKILDERKIMKIENQEQEEKRILNEEIKNTPLPEFEIIDQSFLFSKTDEFVYLETGWFVDNIDISFKVINSTIVKFDDIEIWTSGLFTKNIVLSKPITLITIIASNKHKEMKQQIEIIRGKNENEKRLEKETLEKEENTRVQSITNELDSYIKIMDGGDSYSDVSDIMGSIATYSYRWDSIEEHLSDSNNKVTIKAKTTKNKLISFQKKYFPKMRIKWCELAKNMMRRDNIDVKCYWTKVYFIASDFVLNSTVEDSYLAIRDVLNKLRFKQARFYWYAWSDYTYYTIDSLNDWELK